MGLKPRKKAKPRTGVAGYEQPETVLDALKALSEGIREQIARKGESNAGGRPHRGPSWISTIVEIDRIARMFELRHTNDTGLDSDLKTISEYIRNGDNVNAIGRCNALIGSLLNRLAVRGK